jgi:benzoyl-CoA reductase/2-hydroxyglutaryl-CoA dehydratase subunit BcrC/BadD/HgdB
MNVKQKIKSILLEKPTPKKIARGSLFAMVQKSLTPVSRFHGKAHKRLSVHGYNHGRRFFGQAGKSVFSSLFAPIEMVYAHELYPFMLESFGGLAANFDLASDFLSEMDRQWYTSDFCSVHRVFIGVAHHRLLPTPRFLFSSSVACDGNLKSFAEVGRWYGRPHLYLNVPYGRDRESRDYLIGQLRDASERIEEITGKKLRARNLEKAFHYANETSAALAEIQEIRKGPDPLMYGEEGFSLLLLWGLFMGSRSGAVLARHYRDELLKRRDGPSHSRGTLPAVKKRLLWLHLRPYYPNRIMRILEHELGAVVVAEECNLEMYPELDPDRPWESLADKLLCHSWNGPIANRLQKIKRAVEEYRIDGVVHFSHWGCRQSNGAVRIIRDTVQEQGIAFLDLDGDIIDSRNYAEGQYRTRLEGFMEVLEGR